MVIRTKHMFMAFIACCITWMGYSLYNYFFDVKKPLLTIVGLEQEHYYAGDVHCTIASDKVGDISVWLDEKPLVQQFRMNNKEHVHPFEIPTKTLVNGKHVLKVIFNDTSYRKNKAMLEYIFYVDNVPLQAALIKPESEYKVFQGRTLHVQFQVNKNIKDARIKALSHDYQCFAETKDSLIYEAFVPIACEENPNEYLFSIELMDRVGNTLRLDNKFQVVLYPFKREKLTISNEKLKEEETLGLGERKLEECIAEIVKHSPREKLWRGAFCTPIDVARISCEFGTIRTTQHRGRYAHKAVDIINAPKSVVWACQDGIVALKDRFETSGNTVVIDHGGGVISLYFHLDDFGKINVGEKIVKGNPIGTIGQTGYATGYHLHWEMRVDNVPVDPFQWVKPTF